MVKYILLPKHVNDDLNITIYTQRNRNGQMINLEIKV